MKILLSNDDGIYAEGIETLEATLIKLDDVEKVVTVAPDRDRSGASNSLTLDAPLSIHHHHENRISVQGTPTDCVHLALTGLLEDIPDMVISGINSNSNLGDDILYSGTVAAATEGRFLGLPAIAISMMGGDYMYYDTASRVVVEILAELKREPLPSDTILNINVPNLPYEKLNGFEVTRLGSRHRSEPALKVKDPRGRLVYWIGEAGGEADAGEGTDFNAIRRGKVSITPLKVDLTNYHAIDQVAAWVARLK